MAAVAAIYIWLTRVALRARHGAVRWAPAVCIRRSPVIPGGHVRLPPPRSRQPLPSLRPRHKCLFFLLRRRAVASRKGPASLDRRQRAEVSELSNSGGPDPRCNYTWSSELHRALQQRSIHTGPKPTSQRLRQLHAASSTATDSNWYVAVHHAACVERSRALTLQCSRSGGQQHQGGPATARPCPAAMMSPAALLCPASSCLCATTGGRTLLQSSAWCVYMPACPAATHTSTRAPVSATAVQGSSTRRGQPQRHPALLPR